MHEYASLLSEPSVFEDTGKFGILFHLQLSDEVVSVYWASAVLLITAQGCDFYRRVFTQMTGRFPLRLAWFTKEPHNVGCVDRQNLAKYLLAARHYSDLDNDSFTAKFRFQLCDVRTSRVLVSTTFGLLVRGRAVAQFDV